MKEPVKATSGVYYEKRELERYLRTDKNPTCQGKIDESGKPIPLPMNKNMDLPVDKEMKTKIAKWKKENGIKEDEDEVDNENEIIRQFKSKNQKEITKADYVKNFVESKDKEKKFVDKKFSNFGNQNFLSNRLSSRPRPELSDK